MNKIIWSIALLCIIILSGCSHHETTVKIGYLPVVHSLPLYVAIEKGYFEDAGITIEAIPFEAPNQLVDGLMQGQLDLGSAAGTGIIGIADQKNPGKVKIYAFNGERADNSIENIITPQGSTITSITDLKGKKFGILAGTIQWRTIAKDILAKNGLSMDTDVTIVELPATMQVQALQTHQIDALLALEPIPTVAEINHVGSIAIKAPAKEYIADPFWPGADVVTTKFIEEDPETAKEIIEIFQKTINEINANPEEYKQYLEKYTGLTNNISVQIPLADYVTCNDLTQEDKNAINSFYKIFTTYNVIDDAMSIDQLLYC